MAIPHSRQKTVLITGLVPRYSPLWSKKSSSFVAEIGMSNTVALQVVLGMQWLQNFKQEVRKLEI